MSDPEDELRGRYRRASDDELRALIGQGASALTPTAWALLQEEAARRPALLAAGPPEPAALATSPTRPQQAAETQPYTTPWERLVAWARRVWSGAVTVAGRPVVSWSDRSESHSYTLGWVFVAFQVASALVTLSGLLRDGSYGELTYLALLLLAWQTAAAFGAGLRRAWGWYLLVVGIPAVAALLLAVDAYLTYWLASLLADPVGQWSLADWWVLLRIAKSHEPAGRTLVAILSFVYFYRRCEMFGAPRRWRWLETAFPRVFGPASYRPQIFGISGVAWPVLVVAVLLWTADLRLP